MGIIRELDQSSILRLAAGEIIDRPVSIVKELIENSIDANATKIIISLQQGGISVDGKQPYVEWVSKKPILPSDNELKNNSRARSAKLRVVTVI